MNATSLWHALTLLLARPTLFSTSWFQELKASSTTVETRRTNEQKHEKVFCRWDLVNSVAGNEMDYTTHLHQDPPKSFAHPHPRFVWIFDRLRGKPQPTIQGSERMQADPQTCAFEIFHCWINEFLIKFILVVVVGEGGGAVDNF